MQVLSTCFTVRRGHQVMHRCVCVFNYVSLCVFLFVCMCSVFFPLYVWERKKDFLTHTDLDNVSGVENCMSARVSFLNLAASKVHKNEWVQMLTRPASPDPLTTSQLVGRGVWPTSKMSGEKSPNKLPKEWYKNNTRARTHQLTCDNTRDNTGRRSWLAKMSAWLLPGTTC